MQIFLKHILVWILLISIIASLAEITIRRIPNDIKYKYEYVHAHTSNIQVLIFGSSHELHGVNPSLFKQNAFNVAISGLFTQGNYFFFENYYNRLDSLKVVVLPLSDFNLFEKGFEEDIKNDNGQKILYTEIRLLMDIGDRNFFSYNSIILTYPIRYSGTSFIRRLFHKDYNSIRVDSLGYEPLTYCYYNLSDQERMKKAKDFVKVYDTISGSQTTTNRKYYLDMINQCHHDSIGVILLSTPLTKEYCLLSNKSRIEQTISFGEKMQKDFPNVIYLNLFQSPRFIEYDFADQNHLNHSGATKLSLLIDSVINNYLF